MKNFKQIIYILVVNIVVGSCFISCNKSEIPLYDGKHKLYIENEDDVDSLYLSFFLNQGSEKLEAKFPIGLIGSLLTEDKEYTLKVIDSLTTAEEGDYLISENTLFRKNLVEDTIVITINKPNISIGDKMLNVAFELVENENFEVAYQDRKSVIVAFDIKESKPTWWTNTVTDSFLGVYSSKKYKEFVKATGVSSLEGLEYVVVQELARTFKKYVKENSITEEDGSPMIVPIY